MSKPRKKARARRSRSGQGARWALLTLVGLGSLFVMALQSHRLQQLQREHAHLSQEYLHRAGAYRSLTADWYEHTRRDVIVPRAESELKLRLPGPTDKEVVALEPPLQGPEDSRFVQRLKRGLHRFGEIPGAVAKPSSPVGEEPVETDGGGAGQ